MVLQARDSLVVTSLPFIKGGHTHLERQGRLWADTSTFLSHLLPSLLHSSKEKIPATEVLFNLKQKGWSRAGVCILALKICIFPLTSGMGNYWDALERTHISQEPGAVFREGGMECPVFHKKAAQIIEWSIPSFPLQIWVGFAVF